jgi:hypothetical protein
LERRERLWLRPIVSWKNKNNGRDSNEAKNKESIEISERRRLLFVQNWRDFAAPFVSRQPAPRSAEEK